MDKEETERSSKQETNAHICGECKWEGEHAPGCAREDVPLNEEAVAAVVEIEDSMDSYTQRPAKKRTILPYKPIDTLPVGMKLYAAPAAFTCRCAGEEGLLCRTWCGSAECSPSAIAPLTDSYIQTVPDKCDRIVWRGRYYHLPLERKDG